MKKTVIVSLFFAALFAVIVTTCDGPLEGDYRTIYLEGFGEGDSLHDPDGSGNTPPPAVADTGYIIEDLEAKLDELIRALEGKADGVPETRELEVDGTTCTVTLRKNGDGYDVALGNVDLTNEHALKNLLYGMQRGIPGTKPIYLDFSDCKGSFMPSIIGRPLVDKERFVSVILPDTVTDLYYADVAGGENVRAFEGFTNLKKVEAPSVERINDRTFQGLGNLEVVYLPKAESIGQSAFEDCEKLTTLIIDNEKITVIGDSTFKNCRELTTIDFPNVITIGRYAFQGCSSLTGTISEPLGLDPQEVTLIGVSAFQDCTSLEEVYFPNIPNVPNYAFSGCTNLTSLKADWGSAETIGRFAFSGCTALEAVIFTALRNDRNTIDMNAFNNCNSLTTAYMPTINKDSNMIASGNDKLKDALP